MDYWIVGVMDYWKEIYLYLKFKPLKKETVMKKLLAIIIIMTICLSVYAETNYVDKGEMMKKADEEYAESHVSRLRII